MRRRALLVSAVLGIIAALLAVGAPARAATRCKLQYRLSGWSVFYSSASGTGVVRCDNGQSADVHIDAKGGGVTVGRSEITRGRGSFSPVDDIGDLYGSYGASEVHAGVVRSAHFQVVTRGDVSLTLSGTGRGVDLGVSFGRVRIEPRRGARRR